MNQPDLLKMLDLNARPAQVDETAVTSPAGEPLQAANNPTALDVDEWGLRRGRDLIDESERLKKAGTDELAAADFFTAAFDPDPKLLEGCVSSGQSRD